MFKLRGSPINQVPQDPHGEQEAKAESTRPIEISFVGISLMTWPKISEQYRRLTTDCELASPIHLDTEWVSWQALRSSSL
jgi:hypothetical protein